MARKLTDKGSLLKKIFIIGGSLIVLQTFFIWHFSQTTNPVNISDEIAAKVEKTSGLDSQRKEMLKVQLAINDFRLSNGKLPESLDELKPKYFDRIPLDPATGQPFKYSVTGGKYTLGELIQAKATTPGGGGVVPASASAMDQQSLLIASLDAPVSSEGFVYDPSGRRDPFRPFDLSPKSQIDATKSPLEQYDIGQLRLVAILEGLDTPKASVENQAGKGFIVQKGTRIGTNSGEVVEILSDRIKILETVVDFTGQKKTNVIEMTIRSKDQSGAKSGTAGSFSPGSRQRQ